MKYIVIEDFTGLEFPIIFPDILDHASVAPDAKVVAAGFCRTALRESHGDFHLWSCWGQSVSLGVQSRGDMDEKLIEFLVGN